MMAGIGKCCSRGKLGLRGDKVECGDGIQFTEEVGSSPEFPTGKD